MSSAALYTATVLIWGSTWLAMSHQLGVVGPEVSLVYRHLLSAALLFAWCVLRRLPLRFDRRAHLYFAGLGALLFGLNYVLAYFAQQYISSALNAVAFSSMVWMNILNARLFLGVRSGVREAVGALLGMAGLLLLFLPQLGEVQLSHATLTGAALALGGAAFASLGNILSQHAQHRTTPLPIVQSNAFGMLYGALLTAAAAVALGRPFVIDTSAGYLLSMAYLVVFGSVLGFGAYLTLLGRIGSHRAGYVVVMFPLVALLLAVTFEGLSVTAPMLAGIVTILAGNAVIVSRPRGKAYSDAR